ncbi:putative benzoate 4-monooxygenase cytochrome protein [Botrytis fragariae]|uniref:Putative benzoate 4-monooxygenase cytochrome protein n=1 Tax=Botrytis fragariae TaxID=1964551 RepID=A0A8H6AYP4_9HELO|nr:putative benzoate 4-monooxygenase cytochrome protein [Botrytis fragariae]KAF5876058.1 putative benzoate 4-monooxygenase cytochrome protein [Botrytis fragariae]
MDHDESRSPHIFTVAALKSSSGIPIRWMYSNAVPLWDTSNMNSILLSLAAISSGIAAHLGIFIRGEWHLRIYEIVFSHTALFFVIWFLTSPTEHTYSSSHYVTTLRISGCYLLGLFGSIVTYRLSFHQLKHFPGPRLAAATKFWHLWHSRNSTNHLVLHKVYKEYGPIVRTGPNELCIFHPAGIELLDGAKNNNSKDPWYDLLHPMTSVVFERDPEEVRSRRNAWNKGISTKAVKEYSHRIILLGNDLVDAIQSRDTKPIKLNDLMSWFAFDVMGLITFGEDFGFVRAQKQRMELIHQRGALAMLSPMNDAIWLARVGLCFFPFLEKVRHVTKTLDFCWETIQKRMKKDTKEIDIAQFLIEEYNDLKGKKSDKVRYNILLGSTLSAVTAGSDTTRAGLIAMMYYICKYPSTYDKIYNEVKDIDVTDVNLLASLPHLNATVKEVLRIAPPALTGGARMTGPDGLWVDDTFIPAGVKVTATKYSSHRLPNAFVEPDEFIPERWTTHPELVLDQRAYAPFSVGPRQCVGKAVTLLEMRFVTAILLKKFHIGFSEDYNPDEFWDNLKDQVTMQAGDLFCTFKLRI